MYDDLLKLMEAESKVSRNVLARVLVRVMISAPRNVARADIAKGTMLPKPSTLNQSAVSKAVATLERHKLITQFDSFSDDQRAGRPIIPVRLGGRKWAVMGIKVIHDAASQPAGLYGVLTDLRVDKELDVLAELESPLPEATTFAALPKHIKQLHDDLLAKLEEERQLFGVGVELACHVHEGVVIGPTLMGGQPDERADLLGPLQQELTGTQDGNLVSVPVVIDNDVDVLGVRQTYRPYAERNVVVLAVLNDGVGGSLIIDGHVYRGGGGMAAEPGHNTVRLSPPPRSRTERSGRGFADPCHCGKPDHVDCYSVPTRIMAQLGATSLAEACQLSAFDESGQTTEAGITLRIAGQALGQSIAAIINVVNPARILLFLPGELAPTGSVTTGPGTTDTEGRAQPGSAGAEYLKGVEAAVTEYSFSTGAADARAGTNHLTVQVLDPDQAVREGALCAAVRAFDAFVMHASGHDHCEIAGD
jgi:predicted NBD/HSP70 family sugar kinase